MTEQNVPKADICWATIQHAALSYSVLHVFIPLDHLSNILPHKLEFNRC